MYLSYLLIDTTADPVHPRPGRTWVQNPYRVHQRLWMAFPSDARKARDPVFLDPFVPPEFVMSDPGRRAEAGGFLFRVDPVPATVPSRHVVTVQSTLPPDWEYAFHNAPEFLCARPIVKDYAPDFARGQKYRFRLRANPTKRLTARSVRPDGEAVKKWHNAKNKGRRLGLNTDADRRTWLDRRAAGSGFRLLPELRIEPDGLSRGYKGDDRITLASVRFDGLLEVTDAELFQQAVFAGIGPGKGLGFGLLSVAPT